MRLLVLIQQNDLLRAILKGQGNTKRKLQIVNTTKGLSCGSDHQVCLSGLQYSEQDLHRHIPPPDCTEIKTAPWDGICNNGYKRRVLLN